MKNSKPIVWYYKYKQILTHVNRVTAAEIYGFILMNLNLEY